jgi:hypothetical protein
MMATRRPLKRRRWPGPGAAAAAVGSSDRRRCPSVPASRKRRFRVATRTDLRLSKVISRAPLRDQERGPALAGRGRAARHGRVLGAASGPGPVPHWQAPSPPRPGMIDQNRDLTFKTRPGASSSRGHDKNRASAQARRGTGGATARPAGFRRSRRNTNASPKKSFEALRSRFRFIPASSREHHFELARLASLQGGPQMGL